MPWRRTLPAAAALACAVLLVLRAYPLGLPGWEVFRYRDLARYGLHALPLAGGGLLGILVLLAARSLPTRALLLFLTAAILGMNICLYKPLPLSWTWRVLATTHAECNPFFGEGLGILQGRDYPARHLVFAAHPPDPLPTRQIRLIHYPPGFPLLYHALDRAAGGRESLSRLALDQVSPEDRNQIPLPKEGREAAAATLAVLAHLLALALIPVTTWLLAREFASPDVARLAASASCLIPAFHLLASAPDLLLVPLGTLACACWMAALRRDLRGAAFATGLLVSGGLFCSFTLLPILPILGLMAWGRWRLRTTLPCLAGMALPCLLLLPIGYDSFAMLRASFSHGGPAGRGYIHSLLFNTLEFLAFGGTVWAVGLCVRSLRTLGMAVAGLLGMTIAFRGEVGRTWMFLVPLMLCGQEEAQARRSWLPWGACSLLALLVMSALTETAFGPWT